MNAREELIEKLAGHKLTEHNILCAEIRYQYGWLDEAVVTHNLPCNHTALDLLMFLEKLDFLYDDGYGWQELHGFVWLDDGTWLERCEYDGREWWSRPVRPEIPEHLRG